MLLFLLISFLGTCGTVYFILHKHKLTRKTSISLHVAIDKYSHGLYAVGHFVGGFCFLIFVYKLFYIENNSSTILILAGLYAFFNKFKFYQAQLVFFSVFYLFLIVLLYGGR